LTRFDADDAIRALRRFHEQSGRSPTVGEWGELGQRPGSPASSATSDPGMLRSPSRQSQPGGTSDGATRTSSPRSAPSTKAPASMICSACSDSPTPIRSGSRVSVPSAVPMPAAAVTTNASQPAIGPAVVDAPPAHADGQAGAALER